MSIKSKNVSGIGKQTAFSSWEALTYFQIFKAQNTRHSLWKVILTVSVNFRKIWGYGISPAGLQNPEFPWILIDGGPFNLYK